MPESEDVAARAVWLIALGSQPGVSAWFAVWCSLNRRRSAALLSAPATKGDAPLCPTITS